MALPEAAGPVEPAPSGPGPRVSATWRPGTNDWRRVGKEASRYSITSNAVGTAAIAVGALNLPFADMGGMPPALAVIFIVGGVLQLLGWLTGFLTAWRMDRRKDLFESGISLLADADGLRVATATTTSSAAWRTYRRVRETRNYFLFDHGTAVYVVVPKQVFDAGAIEALRGWARDAGILDERPEWRFIASGVAVGLLFCGGLVAASFALALISGGG